MSVTEIRECKVALTSHLACHLLGLLRTMTSDVQDNLKLLGSFTRLLNAEAVMLSGRWLYSIKHGM